MATGSRGKAAERDLGSLELHPICHPWEGTRVVLHSFSHLSIRCALCDKAVVRAVIVPTNARPGILLPLPLGPERLP